MLMVRVSETSSRHIRLVHVAEVNPPKDVSKFGYRLHLGRSYYFILLISGRSTLYNLRGEKSCIV